MDLYNQNRFLFDYVDQARVRSSRGTNASSPRGCGTVAKSDQFQIDLANARRTLFAGFEPGKTAAFDSSSYEIPDEDIERAYQTRTPYRSGYDEAFREKLAELSQANLTILQMYSIRMPLLLLAWERQKMRLKRHGVAVVPGPQVV